jgi:tetratricopeptide (TPR) repeat protein
MRSVVAMAAMMNAAFRATSAVLHAGWRCSRLMQAIRQRGRAGSTCHQVKEGPRVTGRFPPARALRTIDIAMADRMDQLRRLLDADPGDAFCLYGLAQEYLKAGDADSAIEYFDRAIAADPHSCYSYYHKARALESLDRIDEAAATLREGLARAAECGDAQAQSEMCAYLDQLG